MMFRLCLLILCGLWSVNAQDRRPAMVEVQLASTVGVLLDEFDDDTRPRVVSWLQSQPDSFWIDRALQQINLTTYRMNFRVDFYDAPKSALNLPEQQEITLKNRPTISTIQGHSLLTVDYSMLSYILSYAESVVLSEPQLRPIGGTWDELVILPIDPELIAQRVGYACHDEDEYPIGSADTESIELNYDWDCGVEPPPVDLNLPCAQCHCTEPLPNQTCIDALAQNVGYIQTFIKFKRILWNDGIANRVRSSITLRDGVNMIPQPVGKKTRQIYRYFTPQSCASSECIDQTGWRKLLMFESSNVNAGTQDLVVGSLPNEVNPDGTPKSYILNNLYVFHPCHGHYHFEWFSSYQVGGLAGKKQGFCIEGVKRIYNAEWIPTHNLYGACDFQGIPTGWADTYNIGIPCQWSDVTALAPVRTFETNFILTSNPQNLLCEGTPIFNADGTPVYELTNVTAGNGEKVLKPACNQLPNSFADNQVTTPVTIQPHGYGLTTSECPRRFQIVGPKRDCELRIQSNSERCQAGSLVRLRCSTTSAPQVLRVCDYSKRLNAPIPCRYMESLSNVVVKSGSSTIVTFNCPTALDGVETGGMFSIYSGPVANNIDPFARIECRRD